MIKKITIAILILFSIIMIGWMQFKDQYMGFREKTGDTIIEGFVVIKLENNLSETRK